ncbi:LysR family transcriptional regulator [Siccirubricoccus phaeus]|uniref:LysR family transcriptional regulator n=1 Tax=Siccirubricoccus phaeus TaxID=2595053 RepID=UPI0011F2AA53|nr:LysR family transcriptional regulator [Siccirubricoccus phaeus]
MTQPLLDPELLQAFLAVAEHRSFTRAASRLNRTQSAVSMQVRRLEARLGVALFQRSTVHVALSPAGEGLLGYAGRILRLQEEAVARLRRHRIGGRVRLGVMDDYGALLMPRLLAGFAAAQPEIRVEMETGLTSGMVERLGEAHDLVIAMHPAGQGGGEFLRREQAVWAAGTDPAVEAAAPLPVALYPEGCLFRHWAMAALDAAGRPWRLAFVSHSLAAVEAVAAEGLAVTVVKSGTFPPRLRRLGPREGMPPLPEADIRLHRAPSLSPAAGLLAEHLAAALGPGG